VLLCRTVLAPLDLLTHPVDDLVTWSSNLIFIVILQCVHVLCTVAGMTTTEHQTHSHTDHTHGADCGHQAVPHGDHVDYLHDGHRHAAHGDHYDEH